MKVPYCLSLLKSGGNQWDSRSVRGPVWVLRRGSNGSEARRITEWWWCTTTDHGDDSESKSITFVSVSTQEIVPGDARVYRINGRADVNIGRLWAPLGRHGLAKQTESSHSTELFECSTTFEGRASGLVYPQRPRLTLFFPSYVCELLAFWLAA
ncbi:hypothetical protein DHEL01_v210568 [Diaporthe helianthi]|uniref:Uncharacterized protein n=1 Tax=Diaporthe helianthi TaxID=158607 RepID=A0A2P5HLB6_DIAHE|nr:hypothetical protein DHEL01_v210568 [Diaporthe helianthi]